MIYDVFHFFNELDLLELRLSTLENFVDRFVLIEATHAYSGLPKPLYYRENKKRFTRWMKRIDVITIEQNDPAQDPLTRDRWQRNSVTDELRTKFKPQDIIIYSDLDEIPNIDAIWDYDIRLGIMGLDMYFSFFYLNAEVIGHRWVDAKILPAKLLEHCTMWEVRYFDALRYQRIIRNAGWHFSWCGGAKSIALKAKSFGHALETDECWKDPAEVSQALDEIGRNRPTHPIARFKNLRLLGIDASFPKYVRDNMNALYERGFIKAI